jgi:hypothetical protein
MFSALTFYQVRFSDPCRIFVQECENHKRIGAFQYLSACRRYRLMYGPYLNAFNPFSSNHNKPVKSESKEIIMTSSAFLTKNTHIDLILHAKIMQN